MDGLVVLRFLDERNFLKRDERRGGGKGSKVGWGVGWGGRDLGYRDVV